MGSGAAVCRCPGEAGCSGHWWVLRLETERAGAAVMLLLTLHLASPMLGRPSPLGWPCATQPPRSKPVAALDAGALPC